MSMLRFQPPNRCVAAPWFRAVSAVLLLVVVATAAATGITRGGGGGRTSGSNNNNNGDNPKEQKIRVHEMAVDPFVRSSPMIAAMVCNDGIALVATHIDEPLQFDLVVKSSTSTIESDDDDDAALLRLLLDAPCPSYNQRIMALTGGGHGSTKAAVLMTAGWRADGHGRLLDGARSILARNVNMFGTERIETLPYDLSQFLTTCAGSESLRPLSCAALLALSGDVTTRPCLWLVDETGATAVRALCLGGGYLATKTTTGSSSTSIATTNDKNKGNTTTTAAATTMSQRTTASEAVQKELAKLFQRHQKASDDPSAPYYFDMPATAGLAALVRIISRKDQRTAERPGSRRTRLELAILPTAASGERPRLQRPTIADILGRAL